jgi:hypothetical protein
MIDGAAADRARFPSAEPPSLPALAGSAGLAVALALLAGLGYAAIADPRVALVCVGAGLLGTWGLVAVHRPRLAMALSFSLLLVAGTKFRTRAADASLAGALDAQVVMELALFALIGVVVFALWLTRGEDRRPLRSTELAILAYSALAAVSVLWSEAPLLTVVRSFQLLIVSLFSILVVRSLGPAPTVRMMSWAVAAHVVIFAAIAASSPWAYDSFTTGDRFDDGFRFRWFAAHPIDAATLAGLGAIGLMGALMFWRPSDAARRRLPVTIWVAALVAVMLLTRSRGPILALAIAGGVLWLLKLRPTLRTAAVLFTAAGAAAAFVFASELRALVEWLASRDTLLTQMFFRGQTADTLFELNGRIGLWADLQPVLMDRLTLGYGYQASRAVLLEVADWAAFAHNAFLQTALDLGIVGLLIVAWMFAPIVRCAFSRSRDQAVRATIVALAIFLALNAMSTESFAAVPHFETLLLFVCALCASATVEPRRGTAPATADHATEP